MLEKNIDCNMDCVLPLVPLHFYVFLLACLVGGASWGRVKLGAWYIPTAPLAPPLI